MVSAADALNAAVHEGVLEKKRRTGGWTKKQFFLTPTQWLYFDSMVAGEPSSALATIEIIAVHKSESDPQQRIFCLELYKKRKEYRAKSPEDRDAWVAALESVAGVTQLSLESDKRDTGERGDMLLSTDKAWHGTGDMGVEANGRPSNPMGVDLRALCDQMKKSFSWQLQISKSFSSKDVAEFVRKTLPQISSSLQIQQIGQALIDNKFIVPLKSHVFDERDPGRFKFFEAAAPKQPKNHLNMRAQSIANLMGNEQFSAQKYAEDFLRKHAPSKIDSHCQKLVGQKEDTIDQLKEEISANYTSFIRAASEIKTMENSVSQLKALVLECKRSMNMLKGVTLEPPPTKARDEDCRVVDSRAEERVQTSVLDEFISDLEVCIHERNYEEFTTQILDYKQKKAHGAGYATEFQQAKIEELRQAFIQKLAEEFNASLQTSERMHKKENHLEFLIRLGETHLATEMCLQNYSVRIALQLRHVPSYGNTLNYVINFSRTFFTSLLVCYEDFEHSFHGQKSSHFISLTVWITAQLERFANEIKGHIFPDGPNATLSRCSTTFVGTPSPSPNRVAIDVSEFKGVAKFVSSALRYVFYGSRQLELSGLPTAHCLAPHLARGLLSFFTTYCTSIKNSMKEEIKRERWEMTTRMVRDPENKHERGIVLTQSARLLYTLVQQFLRDVQRVMNPSCATSNLAEVHEAIVWETDELLNRYSFDALQYLEAPKLSSSLRPKQIIGLLTNVAYIQDDCAARSTIILQEYLPKAALQNREVDVQNATLREQLVVAGVKRYAQSLLKMLVNWQELELSNDSLPAASSASTESSTTLFVQTLVKELVVVSNDQLDKFLCEYNKQQSVIGNSASGRSSDKGAEALFSTMVVEALLQEMLQDEPWWQHFGNKTGKTGKRLGFGGVNQFLAEIQVLSNSVPFNKVVDARYRELKEKMTQLYHHLHPEKKEILAPTEWVQAYTYKLSQQPTATK